MKTLFLLAGLALLVGCDTTSTAPVNPNVGGDQSPPLVSQPIPSSTPSSEPTAIPTVVPSATPSATPTITPSPSPSVTPSPSPTITPSPSPTSKPEDLYTGPAEVSKFVQKFVDDAKAQGKDVLPDMKNPKLEIKLGSLSQYGSSVIGLCESATNMRRVTLNPTFWNSVDDTQKELLVHHELGHCVLYRDHRTDVLKSGEYASIMYPIIMSNKTYNGNYNYYQNELFTFEGLRNGDMISICN